MRNLTIAAALLMSSTSLLAQTAQPTPSATTMTPSPTAADTAAAETIGGGASANSAATAAAEAAPAVMAAPVATASADWSSFDGDKDGALSPLEFAMHVDAANSALTAEAKRERYSRASGNGAIKLLNATADDFSKADKNQDRKVDSTELAGWQSGGASASAAPVAVTSGAGEMTSMPSATSDMAAPAETGATMAPSDASDAPEGQKVDDTMATDTPPTS